MFAWFSDLGNSKIAALLVFFPLFVSIIFYVYSNRKRSERLESYKYIPLMDDDESAGDMQAGEREQEKGNSK